MKGKDVLALLKKEIVPDFDYDVGYDPRDLRVNFIIKGKSGQYKKRHWEANK